MCVLERLERLMELFVDAAMAKGQVEIMSTTRSVVPVDVVERVLNECSRSTGLVVGVV
jgi:hypothetical protein